MIGALLGLAACIGKQTVTETMMIRSTDASKTLAISQGAERVIVRRLGAAGFKGATAAAIPTSAKTATLTVNVQTDAAAAKTKEILAEPFTFDIRIEEPKSGSGDSDWIPTSITGDMLDWVQVIGDRNTGKIGIELQFSHAGQIALKSVFKKNVGKDIGIFVRDLLVSKLKIKNSVVSDRVVISGVPSEVVASIFADDVNVGLHTIFTPIP